MRLSFHGATEEVTGSCFLLETSSGKILIDCGMKQGERMCMLRDMDAFSFSPSALSAVVVTHAHFDHTGRLPELVANGYRGPIYMTAPTKGLVDIILDDSLNIMSENAKKCGDVVPYSREDKKRAMEQTIGVGYHTAIMPVPGVSIMFHDAGHILGSSYLTIEIEEVKNENGKPFVLCFSGDLGNDDVPILPDTEPLHRADWLVCESTYGDRDHEPTRERGEKLRTFAQKVLGRGGTLLIPAFSVERTQELLYELDALVENSLLPRVPIFLDSPLAIRATALYRHYKQYLHFDHPMIGNDADFFSFPGLRETLSVDESKTINDIHGPKIIIAGNGMMTGGRILHHLLRYAADPKTGILVIGFQAPGTLGRKILNHEKGIRVFGEEISVRAEVEMIGSFSAHGDRNKIARWLQPQEGKTEKIFLVHGEPGTKQSFGEYLKKQTTAEVVIPRLHQIFER
jgi:metallo-beta-lactamase family protein